jgi:hypothetical protein
LRASTLSADTKADAGQKTSNNHLNPNVLYMMLGAGLFDSQSFLRGNTELETFFID